MPTILLIRHGQASFGSADYDRLSAIGSEQAEIVAGELVRRGLDVQRILSGGLRRQRDTAAPAAAAFDREPAIDNRWDEYPMDALVAAYAPELAVTDAPGRTRPGSARAFQDALDVALAAWIASGGSAAGAGHLSWPAFSQGARAALEECAGGLESSGTALVFTSGGVIAALCAALLELPAAAMIAFNRVAVNTGITKIVSGRRGISLVSFNDHAHLERDARAPITYR